MNDCDVLIAGNGLAALTLALSLPASYRVTVLCKNRLEDTASRHAQGGIAAVLDTCDHVSDHVADTLTAGAGLCHREATEAILSHGAEAIAWLSAQGVRFDQQNNGWDLTREGGHGHRRIVHVADHTGAAVMARLIEHVRCKPQITLLEHHMALDILTDHGHACGLQVWDELHHRPLKLTAAHTVLANGGLGQIYAATTTPPGFPAFLKRLVQFLPRDGRRFFLRLYRRLRFVLPNSRTHCGRQTMVPGVSGRITGIALLDHQRTGMKQTGRRTHQHLP